MKRNFLICMAVIILSLVGCVSNYYSNERITEQSEIIQDKVLYEENNNHLEDGLTAQFDIVANEVSFNEGKIIIRYPSITGIESDDKINVIIENEVMSYIQPIENIDIGQCYSIDYEIKFSNNKLLSIIYYGNEFSEGSAYPIDVFFSTNIDLISNKKLKLIDFIKDDEAFVEIFTGILTEENDDEMKKYLYDYIYQTYGKDDLIRGFNEADDTYGSGRYIFSYITKDGIGISWEVPHVGGDHVEVEIPFERLKNVINSEIFG